MNKKEKILLEIKCHCIDADNMEAERMSELAGMKVGINPEDGAFFHCLKWGVKNLFTVQQLEKLKSYSELLVDGEIALDTLTKDLKNQMLLTGEEDT